MAYYLLLISNNKSTPTIKQKKALLKFKASLLDCFSVVIKKIVIIILIAQPFYNISFVLAQMPLAPLLSSTQSQIYPSYQPYLLRGFSINPDDFLQFKFFVEMGDHTNTTDIFQKESQELINYFFTVLAIPENDLWVNLSPYEKDRIMPNTLAKTQMGEELLNLDYQLKKYASELTHPDTDLGERFWSKVYTQLGDRGLSTDLPVDIFKKIWIVPEQARVTIRDTAVFVNQASLDVMIEEDYLALDRNPSSETKRFNPEQHKTTNETLQVSMQAIREVIVPVVKQEVNYGPTFARLRQIYHAMILATWYKKNLRQSLLGVAYVDREQVSGLNPAKDESRAIIYQQYTHLFRKGAYSLLKDDYDPRAQELVTRQYFSGGLNVGGSMDDIITGSDDSLDFLYPVSVLDIHVDDFYGDDQSLISLGNLGDSLNNYDLTKLEFDFDGLENDRIIDQSSKKATHELLSEAETEFTSDDEMNIIKQAESIEISEVRDNLIEVFDDEKIFDDINNTLQMNDPRDASHHVKNFEGRNIQKDVINNIVIGFVNEDTYNTINEYDTVINFVLDFYSNQAWSVFFFDKARKDQRLFGYDSEQQQAFVHRKLEKEELVLWHGMVESLLNEERLNITLDQTKEASVLTFNGTQISKNDTVVNITLDQKALAIVNKVSVDMKDFQKQMIYIEAFEAMAFKDVYYRLQNRMRAITFFDDYQSDHLEGQKVIEVYKQSMGFSKLEDLLEEDSLSDFESAILDILSDDSVKLYDKVIFLDQLAQDQDLLPFLIKSLGDKRRIIDENIQFALLNVLFNLYQNENENEIFRNNSQLSQFFRQQLLASLKSDSASVTALQLDVINLIFNKLQFDHDHLKSFFDEIEFIVVQKVFAMKKKDDANRFYTVLDVFTDFSNQSFSDFKMFYPIYQKIFEFFIDTDDAIIRNIRQSMITVIMKSVVDLVNNAEDLEFVQEILDNIPNDEITDQSKKQKGVIKAQIKRLTESSPELAAQDRFDDVQNPGGIDLNSSHLHLEENGQLKYNLSPPAIDSVRMHGLRFHIQSSQMLSSAQMMSRW